MTSPLPLGWAAIELGQVADIQLGKMLDRKKTQGTRLPYLRNINVRWDRIDLSDLLEMPFKERELSRYSVLPGDVLICEGGEPGRAAVWQHDHPSIKYQKALHRVRMKAGLLPRWLVFQLLYDAQRGALAKRFTGTTIKHFPREVLDIYSIRIAPLPEQTRIVEAIESYLTRLDHAVATLDRVQRNLERYRASVLKAAVEGRLVPTEAELARAEGRDYEPASVLLERILAERRRRWEEAELKKRRSRGTLPKDDKWRANYEEPLKPDLERLPALPEGWCWASLDQLTHLVRNGFSSKPNDAGDVRILRISAVRPMRLDFGDSKWLDGTAEQYARDLVEPGDLLFTRYNGTRALVGVAALVRTVDRPTVHPDKLIKVRFVDAGVVLDYAELATNTGMSREFVESRIRTTAGQAGVSGSDIKQIPVPLPPHVEQVRIAAETDRHITLADDALAIMRTNATRLSRVRQSVLRLAFEGRLVDQDPTDEPASALLERIADERAASIAKNRKSHTRRKAIPATR